MVSGSEKSVMIARSGNGKSDPSGQIVQLVCVGSKDNEGDVEGGACDGEADGRTIGSVKHPQDS
eukprot:CAMPEP_0195271516 /NCGR_PEP_ID=MMETSP0706-20130129/15120_1 /TAXON_ID=33640 /ORGANISM="Asterionellopsis glacialis, Strain CCMP134" /LENGTH=63 /DNA_ID=CAMNT_0040327249 /DNA_START=105 /DNA_END=296 /DNA_ORIENTATION=-